MGFSGPCVVDRDAYESSPNKRYYRIRHFFEFTNDNF